MTIHDRVNDLLHNWGFGIDQIPIARMLFLLVAIIIICVIADLLTKGIILRVIRSIVLRSKNQIDDIFLEKRVFDVLSHITPAIILGQSASFIFADFPNTIPWIVKLADSFIILILILALGNVLNAFRIILSNQPAFKDKPVHSIFQLIKLFVYVIGGAVIVSELLDKSLVFFFSGLGAMTAVLILVFKDTILGFIASIQLAANDMVRIGDWVSFEKYGADGDVVEMGLTTIKIQNWDKTVSTIPTYAFVSDAFKNWRGMEESGGRRIKRSMSIDMSSIRYCNDSMLDKFAKIQLLSDYIISRREEIKKYNEEKGVDKSVLVNGRHLTNIGVFRVYAENYIMNNPNISDDMTCMVRQLPASENGLPIEIYAFSKVQAWIQYEGIIADIFDHLLSAAPYFDLQVFQNPSGSDFRNIAKN